MGKGTRELVVQLVALGVALAVAAGIVTIAVRWLTRPSDEQAASPDARLAVRTEALGLFPSTRFRADRSVPGRLFAGGSVSHDGGRSWSPLTDPARGTVTLLGESGARPIAVSQQGRVLCGEILFSRPDEAFGLGEIVHAVEWTGDRWEILMPATEPWAAAAVAAPSPVDLCDPRNFPKPRPRPPEETALPVVDLAYDSSDEPVLLTRDSIVWRQRSRGTPGPARAMLLASDGSMYVALDRGGALGFFWAASWSAPWVPIGGAGAVRAVCETHSGTVLAAGTRLLRGWRDEWSPATVSHAVSRIQRFAVHPSAGLVAAWGNGLTVSFDDGLTFTAVRLPSQAPVAWADFDPTVSDALVYVDAERHAYRLRLEVQTASP